MCLNNPVDILIFLQSLIDQECLSLSDSWPSESCFLSQRESSNAYHSLLMRNVLLGVQNARVNRCLIDREKTQLHHPLLGIFVIRFHGLQLHHAERVVHPNTIYVWNPSDGYGHHDAM